jgi:hypothetical protein
MLLRNRREPFNVVEESNQGLIDWYIMHDYEDISHAVVMEEDTGKVVYRPQRGKKSPDDMPPMDKPIDDDNPGEGGD